MSVAVDICNSALIKLGAEPINDLLDDTKEARLCNIQYPKIRDAVLRSAPWSFALKRVELTQVAGSLEFGDGNIFEQPTDCVRVMKLSDSDPYAKYMIEGRRIITALEVVQMFYVSNTTPESFYDANFKEALANSLAADLCYSITQSTTLKQGLEGSSGFWIDQARSHNSQEVSPEDFNFDDFLNARRGGHEIYD